MEERVGGERRNGQALEFPKFFKKRLPITADTNSGAKFSDGNPIIAEDIKCSYQLYIKKTKTFDWFSFIYSNIGYSYRLQVIDLASNESFDFLSKEKSS